MADATCKIDGCEKPVRAYGLCRNHGYRLQKYGDPLGAMPPRPATCSIEGCTKKAAARGWCKAHWKRWRVHGDPLVNLYEQAKPACSIDGCSEIAYGRGWCSKHWQRWRRHGDPLRITRTPPTGLTGEICLIEDCGKPRKARGWCAMHYKRWQDSGTTDRRERPKKPRLICKIEDCEETVECRGWCNKHYIRWRNHGDPLAFMPSEISAFCSQRDCGRRIAKAGLCWRHYRHFKARFMVDQDGKCAICGIPESQAPRKVLLLDHDHVTGQPRALLCHFCNCGLGMFKDDPERLLAAIRYLEETKQGQLALFAA